MSFELVYTSARRGLRNGSSGFCTVAATEGIPRALQDKLESLSGYRHTEAAQGRSTPVNHAHLTVRIQKTIYHVVSRIGDPGIDYSGRTNKIAHHLALTSDELGRFGQGPATLFADGGFWFEEWNDSPQQLEPGRLPRPSSGSVSGFGTWQSIFGDAGWAGLLGHAVADRMQSVSVIVPDTDCTLDLLNEALLLVPVQDRWSVCFSTYYSRHVSGMQCHWRFVLDGTSEARRLRARVQGILVDPSQSSSLPPNDNPFVQAARAGRPQQALQVKSRTAARRRRSITPDMSEGSDVALPDLSSPPTAATTANSKAGVSEVAGAPFVDPYADDLKPVSRRAARTGRTPSTNTRRRPGAQSRFEAQAARSPFDVPEEEYLRGRGGVADFDDDDDADDAERPRTSGRSRSSGGRQRTGLLVVGTLLVAVLGILAYFAYRQFS
ncbi:MAG: hypothetical protein R3C49_13600 [Planctomycetaceae bacterium]